MMRRLRRIQAAARESAASQIADIRAARRGHGGAVPYAVEVPPHIEELLEDMEIEFREKQVQAAEAQRMQQLQEVGDLLDSGAIIETNSLSDAAAATET
ncbi:hypothetical protein AMAG_02108 [Allomyces macrogynus ATCC 38327]|uniref:Uncharacterized protein n=1 Tax=Allomyces macrogynus (strain ATCC 38327) TaxID=578462 RepID=A0A0L0S110_ALLM3|nr:hypothetical protein AMAG_02108 [Allomyces macrogynus ATCC 38327]|eukprot:KNE56282.1 hypothetical protein AMAG_02108 [Allomyces macrogynus ATCC 38327]